MSAAANCLLSSAALVAACLGALACAAEEKPAAVATVLVEAEAFAEPGGWITDSQFTFLPEIGSPYLMAHGLGKPVAPARTTVHLPQAGRWRVLVRTKDWVAPWQAAGAPGRFRVALNGKPLPEEFGTRGAKWHWQEGESVVLPAGPLQLELQDLAGFDGRCDALLFTTDTTLTPPDRDPELRAFRRRILGLRAEPVDAGQYDLVVAGGGYAGIAAAISAARQGLHVALLQDRPMLGGNGSSEVRVWSDGGTMRGAFAHVGEITEEFADRAPDSPAAAEHFGDAWKEKIVRGEPNIALFLNHYVFAADCDPDTRAIRSVSALDCRTGAERRFRGLLFADCTGHGHLGQFAGAAFQITEKGRMGTSNLWIWQHASTPQPWPATPWALAIQQDRDFPRTRVSRSLLEGETFWKGEWYWESGFDRAPFEELEFTRDWNLRAVYGAFSAIRSQPENADAVLRWVSPVGGTRESRRLEGDVILTRDDILAWRSFPDGCVPTVFGIDLHFPSTSHEQQCPDNPFISRCEVHPLKDRVHGYLIPYRCLYSRNVPNLFMAGRCISVTHEALGTVRVMRNCGMMGEVVGKAAYVAKVHEANPRGVYQRHWDELAELLRQPHNLRRLSLESPLAVDEKIAPRQERHGGQQPAIRRVATNRKEEHVPVKSLDGIVVDDVTAVASGYWWASENLPGYVGDCYLRAWGGTPASIRYDFRVPKAGRYEVRLSYIPYENRARNVPVTVAGAVEGEQRLTLDQQARLELPQGFHRLGCWTFRPDVPASVTLSAAAAEGLIHADCVQVVPVDY